MESESGELRVESEEPRGSGEWSIVMTGFSGEWGDLVDATREIFDREDFDASGPAVYPDKYLPAEMADALTRDEADKAAERLETAGATIMVVRSDNLPAVRHRACDYWSQTCIGNDCLTVIDGLITTLNPTRAREWLYDRLQDVENWQKESFLNHDHIFTSDSLEAAVKEGREMVTELETALRQAYPDRAFTIAHWLGDEVTFWQTTADSPREPEDDQELIFIEPSIDKDKQECE